MKTSSVTENYQPYSRTNVQHTPHTNINQSLHHRQVSNMNFTWGDNPTNYNWSYQIPKKNQRMYAQKLADDQQRQLQQSTYTWDDGLPYDSQPNWMGGRNLSIGQAESDYIFSNPRLPY